MVPNAGLEERARHLARRQALADRMAYPQSGDDNMGVPALAPAGGTQRRRNARQTPSPHQPAHVLGGRLNQGAVTGALEITAPHAKAPPMQAADLQEDLMSRPPACAPPGMSPRKPAEISARRSCHRSCRLIPMSTGHA